MSTETHLATNTTNEIASSQLNELVINWHITEACNYNCTYCFAKWEKPNELHGSLAAIEKLLDKLANYFIYGNPKIKRVLGYQSVRLNFAGGEPMMLGSTLSTALVMAKQKGFKTSIITNGSYLLKGRFKLVPDTLDLVGISFDSQHNSVRKELGRIDRKGHSFNVDELHLAVQYLLHTQKGLKTKINTVVNALNCEEDFFPLISRLSLDKWKVLQVMPTGRTDLLITHEQFSSFVQRHSNKGLPISAESNKTMTESYLMIDPNGRFYQNSKGVLDYRYSERITDVGVETALNQISFNYNRFKSRYYADNLLNIVGEVQA
ncbi:viperin family antiviral radical SAM protein [Vibrio breoganii]|uniref:viperin family antiviral radical SAM protein n=1 Tax=Vibrio breoganii TaxID=553239 RepID=UPI000C82EE73|nr:viperin family antiviral radical SAM protein [Vibrio breoganii]PMF83548.1 radical SAM protein [Vibrio breoganii]PML36010.1 radical SAM protein [Vibrio breoganii]PML92996.1 radical SAM protein [Vibrio breoganii]PMM79869.1 radical SAM protein [Vibrio breoganii]PMN61626.1 radical SAM protein [Vibrio breoganii]